jgi:hypothetical protein
MADSTILQLVPIERMSAAGDTPNGVRQVREMIAICGKSYDSMSF